MLLSILLTFASLDPSLHAQAKTHVTDTANRVADQLGLRPVTLEDRMRELNERAKTLDKNNRDLTVKLRESQERLKQGK